MSHSYSVRCAKCGSESNDFNRQENELIAAVKDCYPLFVFSKSKWGADLSDLKYPGIYESGLARFLVGHFACGDFEVVSEYSSDVPVKVIPDCEDYQAICLDTANMEAEKLIAHMKSLMALQSRKVFAADLARSVQ